MQKEAPSGGSAFGGKITKVGREVGGMNWDVLTNEMKRYEYQTGESGRITYGAPAGYHDDCVMALALANHRRWVTEGCGRMLPVVGTGGGVRARRVRGAERVLVG